MAGRPTGFFWLLIMVQILLGRAGRCPASWKAVGQSCYRLLVHEAHTWSDAADKCRELGGSLAVSSSQTEQNGIWGMVQTVIPSPSDFWIGCQREEAADGRWFCTEHNGQISQYTRWANGEPNGNTHQSGYCARMIPPEGDLADKPCDFSYHAICETSQMPYPQVLCLEADSNGRFKTPPCVTDPFIQEFPAKSAIICGSACWNEPRCHSFNIQQILGGDKLCQLSENTCEDDEAIDDDEENYYY